MKNMTINYQRPSSGLEERITSHQAAESKTDERKQTNQSYEQVIAVQRQIAGKDYQTIVSDLSKYDFQGTLGGAKAHVKKEYNHLSLNELQELSSALKAEYQTQKENDSLTADSRTAYRSAIATVNYYATKKRKENSTEKLVAAERKGQLSYQCSEDTVLAAEFIPQKTGGYVRAMREAQPNEEVLSAAFVRKKPSFEDALNGISVSPAKETPVIELDDFDILEGTVDSSFITDRYYQGRGYHLRETRSFKMPDRVVLAKMITGEKSSFESTWKDFKNFMRRTIYNTELDKNLHPLQPAFG